MTVLGLLTVLFLSAAPRAEAPAAPAPLVFELTAARFVRPEVAVIALELRNETDRPIEIAQFPGVSLAVTCRLDLGGFLGGVPGGVSSEGGALPRKYFVELRPGGALFGQAVVEIPPEC